MSAYPVIERTAFMVNDLGVVEVWAVVRRPVDGISKRYVERIDPSLVMGNN